VKARVKEEKKAKELDKSTMPNGLWKGRVEPTIEISKVENTVKDRKVQAEKHEKPSTRSQNDLTSEFEVWFSKITLIQRKT